MSEPSHAASARSVAPVLVYPPDSLPPVPVDRYREALRTADLVAEIVVPPREGRALDVPKGCFLRIVSIEGPQVGDLNLFQRDNPAERFFSGKTRALHGTHVSEGDRLWSVLPYLRPLASIVSDSLSWYGQDPFGGRVHDVIGTRCDPYTHALLGGDPYHYCCHSNLTRALSDHTGLALGEAELLVHDVLNVFMCTGFDRETSRYFMKASPVRPGDHLAMLAETDLIAVLSACPGGDCSATHSSDAATCHPLRMEVLRPQPGALEDWSEAQPAAYDRSHGR